MNYFLLILVFLLPLQNIYLGKLPTLGPGINSINLLAFLSILYSLYKRNTNLISAMNPYVFGLIISYIISYFNSTYIPKQDSTDLIFYLKDILFPYLLFFIVFANSTTISSIRSIFFSTVLPLLYMFKVFYVNLSWMGFSAFQDKLRVNNGTFMLLGSNEIAAFYATYTFIILSVALSEKKTRIKLLLLALAGMNFYCIIYAFSRGGYISSIIGLSVFAVVRRNTKLFSIVFLTLLACFMFGSQIFPAAVVERFDSIFASEDERDESAASRLILWDAAMEEFERSPVFGIGLQSFRSSSEFKKDTHNYFVKVLVENGLVGFFALIIFLFVAFRKTFQLLNTASDPFLKSLAAGFIPCMTSMIIGNLFGDRFTHYPLISYFFVYLAMVVRGLEWSLAGRDEPN